ncbi:hypothetical protein TNCV_4394331 [Trichonephila clavipes]|uniref:Uncharacterized protein n=1 Tax=Trichonephila clavipes TaxID=2585209 RepID=A0A8X7BEX2_TRICX|nr:hypothetical protein TNCV_4394331 [Trichonephila clavipes]
MGYAREINCSPFAPQSSVTELKRALQEVWNRLSPQLIHHLIASMFLLFEFQKEKDSKYQSVKIILTNHLKKKRRGVEAIVPNPVDRSIWRVRLIDATRILSPRWCGVVVRRGRCQLRCRPRRLTMVQNEVVRRQKLSCSLTVRR